MTDQEQNVLAGCLRGEKPAWDAFVLQYSNLVYHTIKKTFSLYHTEAGSEQLEDLYQDFFVSLLRDDFKKLRQFRGDRGCTLASWLRVVASRLTIDVLRKQAPSMVEVKDSLSADPSDNPDASLIAQEDEKLLARALEALSPKDRIFVDLYFRQSLPPEEIASILRVSVSAVYTQKSRILDKLRETLK